MEDKITLTKLIIERSTHTFDLRAGLKVEYYGDNLEYIHDPIIGTVRKHNTEFYFMIVWDDNAESTILNDSNGTKGILEHCGWR